MVSVVIKTYQFWYYKHTHTHRHPNSNKRENIFFFSTIKSLLYLKRKWHFIGKKVVLESTTTNTGNSQHTLIMVHNVTIAVSIWKLYLLFSYSTRTFGIMNGVFYTFVWQENNIQFYPNNSKQWQVLGLNANCAETMHCCYS